MHGKFGGAARAAKALLAASAVATLLAPGTAHACACGCGIFDVGAASLPGSSELVAYFRYDQMDQSKNWEGAHAGPAADNADKDINTSFYTVGATYAVSDNWMVMGELPIYARQLETTDDGAGDVTGVPYSVYTGHLTDLGDLQLSAMYTGFSSDMSTGLNFGVKLPTGNYTGPNSPVGNHGPEFDRDSLPGTGSTDVMIGGYHRGALVVDETLSYFVQARYQYAVLTRNAYRPGNELNAAAGLTYDFGKAGPLDDTGLLLQLLGSYRMHDQGLNADPPNSGYRRLLVAPGFDVRFRQMRLYADVELPLYQDTNAAWFGGTSVATGGTKGQLTASALYKFEIAYAF